jgi:hypothetical protein
MSDQTVAGLNTRGTSADILALSQRDGAILRELASRVAELAARPIEEEKRQLWYRHNALEQTRPLIFCDPENGWNEIILQENLDCEGELARQWEMTLRKEIFWASEMKDDRVTASWFDIPHVYTASDWGMHETRIGGENGGAYTWESPLKCFNDLEKLHFPGIFVDETASRIAISLAEEAFGDILKVRLKTIWWWTQGMTRDLVNLRGLQQIMLDMVDNLDGLHRMMAFLRDGHLARLDFLEQCGLLSLNNDGTYVGSGGFGWSHELPQPDFNGRVRTMDMWGFAESQETVGISPGMFAEFIFPYQLPLLERFGLNCYGCCEPLDKRWEVVQRFPRLRRVSVSAWASVKEMAEKLGSHYIFSWKPNPADLATPYFDEERIRQYLRATIQAGRDCRLEIIMKDNHTICNDPNRVTRWVQITREETGG